MTTDPIDSFQGFSPPLYRQRYNCLIKLIQIHKITKLVDFGCAELKFLKAITNSNEPCLQRLTNLVGVDLDQDLLEDYKFLMKPSQMQCVNKRLRRFGIDLFAGSVADRDIRVKEILEDATPDDHYESKTLISMIELIEHLNPDTLETFPKNMFNFLSPDFFFISTPNSDFNCIFGPDFNDPEKSNHPGFRHDDHKFEWSREEFKNWCEEMVEMYDNYEVEYIDELGHTDASERLKVGPCSQAALFRKKSSSRIACSLSSELTPYTRVAENF